MELRRYVPLLVVALWAASCGLPGDDVEVKVTQVGTASSIQGEFAVQSPASGNIYWYGTVTVVNKGQAAHHVNPHNVSLVTADGSTYSYDVATHALEGKDMPAVDVQPGASAGGIIVFQIPASSTAAKVIYSPMLGSPIEIPL